MAFNKLLVACSKTTKLKKDLTISKQFFCSSLLGTSLLLVTLLLHSCTSIIRRVKKITPAHLKKRAPMEPLVPYFPLFFRGFVRCGLKTDLQILTPEKSEKRTKKEISTKDYTTIYTLSQLLIGICLRISDEEATSKKISNSFYFTEENPSPFPKTNISTSLTVCQKQASYPRTEKP